MENTRLSVKSVAFAAAVLWAGYVLIASLAHVRWPEYGTGFLLILSSLYPGYQPSGGLMSVLIATGYAFVDAAICGTVFAFLYNCCASCKKK
jgi:hypothetical protein